MPSESLLSQYAPLLIVAVVGVAAILARRRPLWAEAYRRLRRNGIALTALAIISLYVGIGVLDSIAWKSSKAELPRTVIDRLIDRPKEYTYSAPFAKMTTGEPTPHPLKGLHVLGTDSVGADVLYKTVKG